MLPNSEIDFVGRCLLTCLQADGGAAGGRPVPWVRVRGYRVATAC